MERLQEDCDYMFRVYAQNPLGTSEALESERVTAKPTYSKISITFIAYTYIYNILFLNICNDNNVSNNSFTDKPSPPQGPLELSGMSDTICTIKWHLPESDGGSPLLDYTVERKESSKKAWQKVSFMR